MNKHFSLPLQEAKSEESVKYTKFGNEGENYVASSNDQSW